MTMDERTATIDMTMMSSIRANPVRSRNRFIDSLVFNL